MKNINYLLRTLYYTTIFTRVEQGVEFNDDENNSVKLRF